MILLAAAALLIQEDWSTWRPSRPATEDETRAVEALLKKHLARPDVPELAALVAQIRIVEVHERPMWRFTSEVVIEHRTVVRVVVPLQEEPPPRTMHKVDPDIVERPFYDGWTDKHWMVPMEGTAEAVDCGACEAEGEVVCGTCRGGRQVTCSRCASGRVSCSSCSGSGRRTCSTCGGGGRTGSGKYRRSCSGCGGSGKRSCGSCSGGKVQCSVCSGSAKVTCRDCGASGKRDCKPCAATGRLVQSISVRIGVTIARSPETFSALGDAWIVPTASAPEAVMSQDLNERAAKIPDEPLRNALLAHAGRERARAERVLRQRLLVSRMPVFLVVYEVAGRRYEAAVIQETVQAYTSPVTEWSAKLAASATALESQGDAAGAMNDAMTALRVDPDCREARAVVARIEARRAEALEREAREASEARMHEEMRRHAEHRRSEAMQLMLVAGAIGLGLVTTIGILIWRAICRARWDGGVRTR